VERRSISNGGLSVESELTVPSADAHGEALRNFCAAIRGEAELVAPGEDARTTLAVLMEIIEEGDAASAEPE
jgi:hypothetical protein